MPTPGTSNEKRSSSANTNYSNKPGECAGGSEDPKKFLTISPALPCLPAVPKRHKLQSRSNSTLSVGENELSSCASVILQASSDGTLQAYRSQKEKEKNPHRLHLDRRGLTSVPDLVNESRLRFLSLQHNLLTKLDYLSALRLNQLVFLDLYDNHLERISGIDGLENLRVLLIGKNRIKSIEGLNSLTKLEVLDLHGNQVAQINGLKTLKELKVLNLAGNIIKAIGNCDLRGLISLRELNLRKNKIRSLQCFTEIPMLTKLYLSNNDIQGIDDLKNIAMARTLKEISIDGNPVSYLNECVSFLVSQLPNLELISNIQVTDEMRKAASVWSPCLLEEVRSGDLDCYQGGSVQSPRLDVSEQAFYEDRGESPENSLHIVKLPPLTNSYMLNKNPAELLGPSSTSETYDGLTTKPIDNLEDKEQSSNIKFKQKLGNSSREQGGDFLIEINGRILSVYGQGALRYIDRPWNSVRAGDVTTVKFCCANFTSISLVLSKIKSRFPNAEHFYFDETNIYCLGQLNALSDLQGITSLYIDIKGNPITEKPWRQYAIYRLSHWGLKIINGTEITDREIFASEEEFQGLTELAIGCLPDSLLEPLLERLQITQCVSQPRKWLETADPAIRSVVAKEALQWRKSRTEDHAWRQKAKNYLGGIIEQTISAIIKLRRLKEEWPDVLHEIVRDTLVDYSQMEAYMKKCMLEIKI